MAHERLELDKEKRVSCFEWPRPFLWNGVRILDHSFKQDVCVCVCVYIYMKYCHTLKEDEQETERCTTTTSQAVLYGVFADAMRTGNSWYKMGLFHFVHLL